MRVSVSLVLGLLAALGTFGVATTPVRLEPGRPGWTRCVGGAGGDGVIGASVTVVVPGVDRGGPAGLRLITEGGPADVSVSIDRGTPLWLRVSGRAGQLLALPPTRIPGLHLTLRTTASALRLQQIEVVREGALPFLPAVLAFVAAAGLAWVLSARFSARLAWALGLLAAGLLVIAQMPVFLLFCLPSSPALLRVLLPCALVLAGVALGLRGGEALRFGFGASLLAAAVFGAWVRAYALPSAGSWDVDYWKACALRTAAHGVSRAYGDPESIPPGHFAAQLKGDEPAWELPAFGRTFVIDQPPGIMLMWQTSWRLLSRVGAFTQDEALNVAAKLPAIAGDLLAVGVLLWAFGGATRQGLTLAALYWALPLSWLPGAVLGFFDGAYAPLAVAALVAAGRGRARLAGGLLAAAALVKSLALLMAPAVAIALWTARVPLRRAVAVGLAVVAVALVPFVVDGTLPTAVVHVSRIIFQERLSGGYGNLWWILGHVLTLGPRAATAPVPFVRIEAIPFPVRPLGTALVLVVAVFVARLQRCAPGPRAAALAAAVLVLAYGQLAIGIHENHPHAFVLALIATGLSGPRLRAIAATFLATYVLNMLALSGLGRVYTMRYAAVDPLLQAAAAFRMSLGFDVTLLLAGVNVAAFAWLLLALPAELAALADQTGATRSPASQSAPAPSSSEAALTSTGGNSSR